MDSSRPAEKKPRAYILDLPMEMLQHIAGFCSEETLVQLRLTCRRVEGAVLDQFVEKYFSRLECFMLSPARLQRVLDIMSHPHLVAKPVCIVLTMSALVSRVVSLASERNQNTTMAVTAALENYDKEQRDLHVCPIEGMSATAKNSLYSVLEVAAQTKDCTISIEVVSRTDTRVSKRQPQLLKDILTKISDLGCTVSRLGMSEQFAIEAAYMMDGGACQQITKDLDTFRYAARVSREADLLTKPTLEHWRIIAGILQQSTKLQHLAVFRVGAAKDVATGSVLLDLCTVAFAQPDLRNLRTLILVGLNMPAEALLYMLKQCTSQLSEVQLGRLELVGIGDIYGKVFRMLKDMPQLEGLLCFQLRRRTPNVIIARARDLQMVQFLVRRQGRMERQIDMPERKPMKAKAFLKLNTETPLEYD